MSARVKISLRNDNGFTLVEMLMAMLIMTVGLLGLLQSVNVAYEHNARNRFREESVLIAEENLNKLRLNSALSPITTFISAGTKFTVTRESAPINSTANKLMVSVRWAFKNVTTTHQIYTIKEM